MDAIFNILPAEWRRENFLNDDNKLIELQSWSSNYYYLQQKTEGSFNLGVTRIVEVQNPFLYLQFMLKKEEYELMYSGTTVKELYHDTSAMKIHSIVSSNLDWRLANRIKYGRGVSFSPSPAYANRESSRNNGTNRAMIVADVLVSMPEIVNGSKMLPADGYDTTVGNCGQVYVKYYDNEFYPKYVVFYQSKPPQPYFRRRRYF